MRARLHNFIDANWYGPSRWTRLLFPLAWLFRLATWLRRLAYQAGLLATPQLPVPVIVVGNISVGGTGKTPIVAWLAAQLLAQGHRVGIVSRGYGGRPSKLPVMVQGHMDPAIVGDEPVMLARQTGCPVCVCIDRVAAVTELAEAGVDVVVADDGLQHYRMQRAMEIVVIDAERGLGNGWLLPAGPLRESPGRLAQVDCVLLNGTRSAALAAINGIEFYLQTDKLIALNGGEQRELGEFAGRRVWMVAGIGNPGRFARLLRGADIQIDLVPVPDHGEVSLAQLRQQQPQPILMTEKDAVKYSDNEVADCWYLPVQVVFGPAGQREILSRLTRQLDKFDTSDLDRHRGKSE